MKAVETMTPVPNCFSIIRQVLMTLFWMYDPMRMGAKTAAMVSIGK